MGWNRLSGRQWGHSGYVGELEGAERCALRCAMARPLVRKAAALKLSARRAWTLWVPCWWADLPGPMIQVQRTCMGSLYFTNLLTPHAHDYAHEWPGNTVTPLMPGNTPMP